MDIKSSLKIIFEKFNNGELSTTLDFTNKFEEIFRDRYIEEYDSINEAYYQMQTQKYYIENSNGMYLEVVTGDGDIFGSEHSHYGTDIIIYSKLSKDSECRDGIIIFLESEKQECNFLEKIDAFFDVDLSKEGLEKNEDNFIYKTLQNNEVHSEDLVVKRYTNLKQDAEHRYKDEEEYYMISPYGGLDVTFHYPDESLYNEIIKYSEDEYFLNRALNLFQKDYPNFFNEKIDELKHILYIIEHKEDYYRIAELKDKSGNTYFEASSEIEKLMVEKSCNQIKIDSILNDIEVLENKKYNIIDILFKKNLDTQIAIKKLKNKIVKIEMDITNIDKKIKKYQEDIEYEKDINEEIKQISSKLEYPLEDFNVIGEYEDDMYIDGKFREIVIVDRLSNNKNEYISKINELKQMQEIATDKQYEINLKNDELKYSYNI